MLMRYEVDFTHLGPASKIRKRHDRRSKLYAAAIAIEKNPVLNQEIKEWEITITDGIDNDEAFPIV